MEARIISSKGERTHALIFATDDEVVAGLKAFASKHGITSAHFTAIGALSDVTLGYFDWQTKRYDKIPIAEQVEVLALIGDIALDGDVRQVHAHIVVGKRDGTAHGGHLIEAHVRPTLEVILEESPAHLRRVMDRESGLALIDIRASDGG